MTAIAIQPDGKLLVPNQWSEISEPWRCYFDRLFPNGTADGSFNPRCDIKTGAIFSVSVLPGSKILVAGSFESMGGKPRSCIAQLYPNGSADDGFIAQADGTIYCMAPQDDGKILIGGSFTTLNGLPHLRIGRLDSNGVLDTNFNASADGPVEVFALQPDGKILVAGEFIHLRGAPRQHVGRLNPDGTLDTSFETSVVISQYPYITCLQLQPDGKILLGGWFTELNGESRSYLARLNPDGTTDTSFNPMPNSAVYAVALQTDGKIIAAGYFTNISGVARAHVARLNPDGTVDPPFNPNPSYAVTGLNLQGDGKVLLTAYGCVRLHNTDPAINNLTYSNGNLVWFRGGTSPEVTRTEFALSINGLRWTTLGSGTRSPEGWILPVGTLPHRVIIRARGFVTQGNGNWFVECYRGWPMLNPHDTSFGMVSSRFGFNVLGTPGTAVALESSADLTNWSAVQTNTLQNACTYIQDGSSTNFPLRFYRLREVPLPPAP